jgi:inosine/xanthosine triphosphatase
MVKIAIGSKNPAKVQAVNNVFQDAEILSLSVESGVSEQPFSDDETIEGAVNRAKNCLIHSHADMGIGLEGGVVQTKQGLFLCNWGAMVTRDSIIWIAGGARILLPDSVATRLINGEELGPVMDDFTKKANISKKEGAIGVFTNERITRAEMFEHIMRMLLGQYEYQQKIQN